MWTVPLEVHQRRCSTTMSAFALRVESESRRSPACCTPCCECCKNDHILTNHEKSELMIICIHLSSFLPAVHPVTAGRVSGCRGCILCGSAGSSSPSIGLLSCCVPCITRSVRSFWWLECQKNHIKTSVNASASTICSENVTEASLPAEIIYSPQATGVRSSSFLCVLAGSEVKESFPGFEGERKVGGQRHKRPQSSRGVITVAPALLKSHYSN